MAASKDKSGRTGWLNFIEKVQNNNSSTITKEDSEESNAVSRENNFTKTSLRRKLPPLEVPPKAGAVGKERRRSTEEEIVSCYENACPESSHSETFDSNTVEEARNSTPESDSAAFPKVARTIQMASSWLKKSRQPSKEQKVDPFLDRLEMFGPRRRFTLATLQDVATHKHWIIDPSGKFLLCWLVVVAIAVLYNLIFIIARQCFHELHNDYMAVWFVLDYTCDFIYGLDMFCQFRTAYLEQGLLVKDLKKLQQHYMTSKLDFKLDVISLLPYDLLYFAVGSSQTIVRIPRILRVYRVLQLFRKSERKTQHPNLLRSSVVVLTFSLIFHWNACFYFAISKSIGFGTDKWVYPNLTSPGYNKLSRQYLYSVYWSARMMITGENENPPETDMELLFVIVDLTMGYLIFAALIGQFGAILSQMMRARVEFQDDSETIKQYLQHNNVSPDLETRVVSWIDYMWQTKQSFDQEKVLRKLPEKLRAQITVHVHLETLRRVEVFSDCEPGLLKDIVVKLKSQVYSPGDYICRKGDVGKEMYIVKSGRLQVVGSDGLTVLATLSEGSYFGEISILNLSEIGNRRTADVRSVGFSDLLCLSKNNLLDVLTDYPEARTMLEERGRNLLKLPT